MPTKESLVRRTIIKDPLCDHCRSASENPLHALWSCHELDIVCSNLELWSFKSAVQFLDFKELLSSIIMQEKNLEVFAITMWSIWTQRNQARLHQAACALHQVAQLSRERLAEFLASQVALDTHSRPIRWSNCHWQPPPQEYVKINFDGAVFPKENKVGIDVVIRNNMGLVNAYSGDEVHALAAAMTLSFASNIGISRAVLKGDSWVVIKALMEDNFSLASFGFLVEDVKGQSQNFDQLLYSHTKKEEAMSTKMMLETASMKFKIGKV
ncbi:hypothetical protein SO802_026517 [Lithocarpus litseifolius]|uniref:RNase H type-1 domain-containing protein n=1 Tax=Lithocarpus litseifolius TaxID=425828 RepID=A0AAW2C2F5_9ROSI